MSKGRFLGQKRRPWTPIEPLFLRKILLSRCLLWSDQDSSVPAGRRDASVNSRVTIGSKLMMLRPRRSALVRKEQESCLLKHGHLVLDGHCARAKT
jgi:hypothetical protein